MDMTIANLHISVHRTLDTKRPELAISRPEQEAKRTAQLQRIAQERQHVLDWYALHGGR
jgi:hypothetical protein